MIESVGYHVGVPTVLLMTWIALAILFVLSFIATRKLNLIPQGLQNGFETVFEFIFDLVDSVIGKEGKQFYPLFIGLFLFILMGNLIGLIPGLQCATANLNTTVALALVTFFSTHFFGVRRHGFVKYLSHFTGNAPIWLKPLVFIIEIISETARPLSLSFRLFGNMLAKDILIGTVAFLVVVFFPSAYIVVKVMTIVPLILQPAILMLGLLVSVIQAFVFTLLSIFYIGGAIKIHS